MSVAREQLSRDLDVPERQSGDLRVIGQLAGFDVEIKAVRVPGVETRVMIGLADTPLERLYAAVGDLAALDPAGVVMRLENRIRGLEHVCDAAVETLARVHKETAAAESRNGLAFDQEQRLVALRHRQAEIEAALMPAESERAGCEGPGRSDPPKDPARFA